MQKDKCIVVFDKIKRIQGRKTPDFAVKETNVHTPVYIQETESNRQPIYTRVSVANQNTKIREWLWTLDHEIIKLLLKLHMYCICLNRTVKIQFRTLNSDQIF